MDLRTCLGPLSLPNCGRQKKKRTKSAFQLHEIFLRYESFEWFPDLSNYYPRNNFTCSFPVFAFFCFDAMVYNVTLSGTGFPPRGRYSLTAHMASMASMIRCVYMSLLRHGYFTFQMSSLQHSSERRVLLLLQHGAHLQRLPQTASCVLHYI